MWSVALGVTEGRNGTQSTNLFCSTRTGEWMREGPRLMSLLRHSYMHLYVDTALVMSHHSYRSVRGGYNLYHCAYMRARKCACEGVSMVHNLASLLSVIQQSFSN